MMLLLAPIVLAAAAAPAPARDYAVILAVTTDAEGRITSVTVDSVIDPGKGTAPVKVAVPDAWLAAARARIEAKPQEPKARTYFTYFPFNPDLPDRTP